MLKKDPEEREKQLKADLERAQKDEEFAVELRKRLGMTSKAEKKDKEGEDGKLSCS